MHIEDHEAHNRDERRAMELAAGLVALAGVAATGLVIVLGAMAVADQLTGLDWVEAVIAWGRS